MNNNPKVSIPIITYNQKEYLRECIESCLAQTYKNIEIVVADDASTDGTQELLKEYDKSYPGTFVLKLSEKNLGITENCNQAHFACSGKYIAWMGGDDLMLPGKLTTQVSYMENNPNCTICYHNLDVFDSDSNSTLYYFNEKNKINGNIVSSIRNGTFNGGCSTFLRTDSSPKGGFNSSLPVASDWLFWVETLASGGTIDYIDEVLGRYRRHSNNVTNKQKHITQNELDHLNTCNIILAKYPQYSSDAIFAYSQKLLSLRDKLSYGSAMWTSFCINRNYKVFGALFIYLLSFKKIKL